MSVEDFNENQHSERILVSENVKDLVDPSSMLFSEKDRLDGNRQLVEALNSFRTLLPEHSGIELLQSDVNVANCRLLFSSKEKTGQIQEITIDAKLISLKAESKELSISLLIPNHLSTNQILVLQSNIVCGIHLTLKQFLFLEDSIEFLDSLNKKENVSIRSIELKMQENSNQLVNITFSL